VNPRPFSSRSKVTRIACQHNIIIVIIIIIIIVIAYQSTDKDVYTFGNLTNALN